VGAPVIGTTKVLVSVNVMQFGPVRHGGSQGLWQHGSWVDRVTGMVPSVGSKTGVAVVDMGFLFPLGGKHWAKLGRAPGDVRVPFNQ
jgi:hypothetical protein